jgi:nitric oxide reductase activation protein
MRSRLSTRFGAALRHATRVLAAERCEQRLLLLITDGEPHDIDIFDQRYLIEDAQRSVREAARHGIGVFCVTLDPSADSYVRDIFGVGGYRVLDRVEALPEVLPAVVMRLKR